MHKYAKGNQYERILWRRPIYLHAYNDQLWKGSYNRDLILNSKQENISMQDEVIRKGNVNDNISKKFQNGLTATTQDS